MAGGGNEKLAVSIDPAYIKKKKKEREKEKEKEKERKGHRHFQQPEVVTGHVTWHGFIYTSVFRLCWIVKKQNSKEESESRRRIRKNQGNGHQCHYLEVIHVLNVLKDNLKWRVEEVRFYLALQHGMKYFKRWGI